MLQRSRGRARVGLRCGDDQATRLTGLFQEGCLKVRLPRPQRRDCLDAVIINTSGGLTGGDALSVEIDLAEGARATVTTPGCERIYRSIDGEAAIHHRLRVGRGARLDWLPQETIVFDRARLRRRFEVDVAGDGETTLAESIVFGRAAMGEAITSGFLHDFWTVRRDSRLVFADAIRISEPFAETLASPATLGGRIAMASVIHVGSELEAKRDAVRDALAGVDEVIAGASVVGEVLVARVVAARSQPLRRALTAALAPLREGRPVPRNWLC